MWSHFNGEQEVKPAHRIYEPTHRVYTNSLGYAGHFLLWDCSL